MAVSFLETVPPLIEKCEGVRPMAAAYEARGGRARLLHLGATTSIVRLDRIRTTFRSRRPRARAERHGRIHDDGWYLRMAELPQFPRLKETRKSSCTHRWPTRR